MPTTAVNTWTNQKLEPYQDPEDARMINVTFTASAANIPKGTVLGQIVGTGKYEAYANAGTADPARAIAAYDMQIDASGNVSFSSTALQSGNEFGLKHVSAPVYVGGTFRTNDLVGLDAGAVVDLGGFLMAGSVTDGILRF